MKRKKTTFDDELLALQRIVRIIEAFEDLGVKARIARYIRARYLEGGPLMTAGEAREIGKAIGTGFLDTPLPQLDARQVGLALEESLPLVGPRPSKSPFEGDWEVKLATSNASNCRHGAPLGADCFACEAEAQVAKDRHSSPLGGIAE